MSRYEATFEVDSKNGSHVVRQILEHVHDTVREESRSIRKGTTDVNESLESFETLRDAAREPSPGELRIVYERYDEDFED